MFFVAGALLLAVRYVAMPRVDEIRPRIEQMASRAVKAPVTIGRIDASWRGLESASRVEQTSVLRAADDRPDLVAASGRRHGFLAQCGGVRASLLASCGSRRSISTSCACRAIDFQSVDSCSIRMKRARTPARSDWILAQGEVVIRDARIRYSDRRDAGRQRPSSSSRTSTCSSKTCSARTWSACRRSRPLRSPARSICARAFVMRRFRGRRITRAGPAKSSVRSTTPIWPRSRTRSTRRSRSSVHRARYAAG